MEEQTQTPFVKKTNTRYLETLVGYNVRRTALVIIGELLERMSVYDLLIVDFSVMSLIRHNPGITSRQLCNALGIQAPNLVGMISALEKRELIMRLQHPNDGRAMGLHLTESGEIMMQEAEKVATSLELKMTSQISNEERKTLITLLKKIYKSP